MTSVSKDSTSGVNDPSAIVNGRISPQMRHNENSGVQVTSVDLTSERSSEESGEEDALDLPAESDLATLSRDQLATLCEKLLEVRHNSRQKLRSLKSQVAGLSSAGDALESDNIQLRSKLKNCEAEINLTKEALAALKADRKRLKTEKFELLNQMKQLYQTLEEKEKEFRDFIRSYEQRMKKADDLVRCLSAEKEQREDERWSVSRHFRADQTEQNSSHTTSDFETRENQLKQVSDQLYQLRRRLSQLGYTSDDQHEYGATLAALAARSPPPQPPPSSSHAASSLVASGSATTPNGRGSSADSGVRLGSDGDLLLAGGRVLDGAAVNSMSGNLSDSTSSGEGGGSGVCYAVTATGAVVQNRRSANYTADYDTLSVSSKMAASTPNRHQQQRQRFYTPQNGDEAASPALSPTLPIPADSGVISKSAEQLDSLDHLERKVRSKSALKQAAWGSISRVFSRQKQRLKQSYNSEYSGGEQCDWTSTAAVGSLMSDQAYSDKLRLLEEAQQLPMERWKAAMVLAWLQVTLGMPQYGPACAENVRSGKMMLEMSDTDVERLLAITQTMHRRKLRLAIEELRQPQFCKYPFISQLNHVWICSEWLPSVGLAQYAEIFAACLVDGRVLAHISKKDMEKHLNVNRKFHQVSLLHGIQLLRLLQFDRQIISERRRCSEMNGDDVLLWTNRQLINWVRLIDLAEYADNLKDSGVHGALIVLELSFTVDTLSHALKVPQSQAAVRRHLAVELDKLIRPARLLLDEEARYSRWQRHNTDSVVSSSTLGRQFSRAYAGGVQKNGDKDKRNASLRGSVSRALGLRCRQDGRRTQNEPVYETARELTTHALPFDALDGVAATPSGNLTPDAASRRIRQLHNDCNTYYPAQQEELASDRTYSTAGGHKAPSAGKEQRRTHRRIKSISDVDSLTATPV